MTAHPPPLPLTRRRRITEDIRRRPITVGLALAAIPALWWLAVQVSNVEDRVRKIVRHEIGVHDEAGSAHSGRWSALRDEARRCEEIERGLDKLTQAVQSLRHTGRRRR